MGAMLKQKGPNVRIWKKGKGVADERMLSPKDGSSLIVGFEKRVCTVSSNEYGEYSSLGSAV